MSKRYFWKYYSVASFVLCGLSLIVVLVMVFTKTLFFRLDLTEEGRYSLSEATKRRVSERNEPLPVRL